MTVIKKILFILILVAVSIIFVQSIDVVFGAGDKIEPGYIEPLGDSVVGIKRADQIVGIIIVIVRWTYTIFFIIAVLYILFAAYTYLTAQAEPEKIKNATNQIIYASIAIAVALLAVSINAIVGSIIEPSGGETGGGAQMSQPYQTGGGTNNVPSSDRANLPIPERNLPTNLLPNPSLKPNLDPNLSP